MGEQLSWCFQRVDIQSDRLAIKLCRFHNNCHLFDTGQQHSQFHHFQSHQRVDYSYPMVDCHLLVPNRHPMMEFDYSNCCLAKLLSFELSLLLLKSLSDWLYENELWNLSNFLTNQTFDWIANQNTLIVANNNRSNPNPQNWLKIHQKMNKMHLYWYHCSKQRPFIGSHIHPIRTLEMARTNFLIIWISANFCRLVGRKNN